MNSPLATLAPGRLASPTRHGSGMAQQTLAGSVSAFFALESFDGRRGVATYALRVVNRTTSALICRTWVVSRTGDTVLAHPILVEVAPLSTSATQVPVWPGDFASFDRAIAEIAGDGVHCIVEAPAPPSGTPRRAYAVIAAAALGTICCVFGAAVALREALPRITAFAVPPEAIAGTTIRAEYDASGAGRLSYSVIAPDGRRLQAGVLGDLSGSIPISIPASNDPGAYTLQMAMTGPLGTVMQTRVLNALVGRVPGAAQIDAISVEPAVAEPSQTVNVAYSAAGDAGYVRLLGSDGTIWQERPFSRNGQTQFVIPPLTSLREMRVVLRVTKGGTVAQSMAGVVVANNRPAVNDTPQIAGDDDPDAAVAANSGANGTFEVLTPTVKSGGSIHVRILSPRNGMRIALSDSQSRELSSVAVGAEANAVTLRAPVVTAPGRYTVVASFTDGFGQESIVQSVTVAP